MGRGVEAGKKKERLMLMIGRKMKKRGVCVGGGAKNMGMPHLVVEACRARREWRSRAGLVWSIMYRSLPFTHTVGDGTSMRGAMRNACIITSVTSASCETLLIKHSTRAVQIPRHAFRRDKVQQWSQPDKAVVTT